MAVRITSSKIENSVPQYLLTNWKSLEQYTWKRGYEIDYTRFELIAINAREMSNLASRAIYMQKQHLRTIQETKDLQTKKENMYEALKQRTGLSTKEFAQIDLFAQEIGEYRAKIGKLEKEIEELGGYAKKTEIYAKYLARLYNAEHTLIEYTKTIIEFFKTESNLFMLMGYVSIYELHLEQYLSIRDSPDKPQYQDIDITI